MKRGTYLIALDKGEIQGLGHKLTNGALSTASRTGDNPKVVVGTGSYSI